MIVNGFSPLVDADSRLIILGTLPGKTSLKASQYYADPGNSFWFIMSDLLGIAGNYEQRVKGLLKQRFGLWDVLHQAEREASLDGSIIRGTEVPNDFASLLASHPSIEAVHFNGTRAERYFRDLVPRMNVALGRLPSSSGANTHLTKAAKLEKWRAVLAPKIAEFGAG
jgi:double-stranded uracil-DNA glycosylase